ncbi:hypothetical protein INT45_012646 [Circinella minor]|uniref:Uncharacterized protein n=1 Tax=Circinella minor TaxID=1195481 RepID=A0A8H7S2C8_9FUNG|nr:hypothetical protein INT45_012646 [Circinella minor]
MDNVAAHSSRDGPDALEIMSEVISLMCMTILGFLLGAKSKRESLVNLTYGRILVFVVYMLSWSFAVTSMVSVSTNNYNITSCTLAMLACDVFYASSKIVIYMWLIERVHVVTAKRTTRFKSWQYRFHIMVLIPYIGIFVLMLMFRNIYLLDSGECVIGLKWVASMPLMCYDFFLNLYLTYLFVKPLLSIGRKAGRENWRETRLYKLTKRTLIASLVCLLVSLANVMSIVISRGHLRGLVCLSCCTLDVTINVMTIHWVTTSSSRMSARHAGAKESEEPNENTECGASPHQTREIANNSTTNFSAREKFNFQHHPSPIRDDVLYHIQHHHQQQQLQDSDDSLSIGSIQVSQSSVKPLHEFSL